MALVRNLLLAGSQSVWLRECAMRYPFVRRSVSRFMPGERIEDALDAARELKIAGITTILTKLGENLTNAGEAESVTAHYLDVLERVSKAGLDAHISVKPTQLGLDLDEDEELCFTHLRTLVERAESARNFVWIDMESTPYVDRTLRLFRRIRERSQIVGVAIQAYLYRSQQDLESLLPLGPAIRIVKGAYKEPPSLASPRKKDVDENFFRLCTRLMQADAVRAGSRLHVATHDQTLIERLRAHARAHSVPASAYEFAMLYGIQRPLQRQLVAQGQKLRVLISYGEYWFPWYMRRLAERPANVMFVLKNMVAG
jgi:proline dehydrogenase